MHKNSAFLTKRKPDTLSPARFLRGLERHPAEIDDFPWELLLA
jgi:hypothetical protein